MRRMNHTPYRCPAVERTTRRPPRRPRALAAVAALTALTACATHSPRIPDQGAAPGLPAIAAPPPLPDGATPPERVHRTPLVLPHEWMAQDEVLRIDLRIAIDTEGRPRQSEVLAVEAPDEMKAGLAQIARAAAAGWRFRPAQVDGRPVPAWLTLTERMDLPAWWAGITSPPPIPDLPPDATPARFVHRLYPTWPPSVPRRRGAGYSIRVQAEVLPSGAVGRIWIREGSGQRLLDLATLGVVRRWRAEPARDAAGRPLASMTQTVLKFRVSPGPPRSNLYPTRAR